MENENKKRVKKVISDTVDRMTKVNDGYLIKFGQVDKQGNLFTKDTKFNMSNVLKDKLEIDDIGLKFKD